jgi:hypothetical protein
VGGTTPDLLIVDLFCCWAMSSPDLCRSEVCFLVHSCLYSRVDGSKVDTWRRAADDSLNNESLD